VTPERKYLLKVWVAAGLWMVVIAIESTKYFSAAQTSRYLYPLLRYLFGLTWEQFKIWHFYIRKTGHFVGYFILSWLLFRAWKATLHLPRPLAWALRWATVAFFMSVLVASLDEWHQSYLPSRTGTVHDVILDSIAALTAQIVILVWLRSRTATRHETSVSA
jgi:VanZ family protein